MKRYSSLCWVSMVIVVFCLFVSGCGEPFSQGFGSGVVAMKVIADDSQDKFLKAVNELNEETAKLNTSKEAVENISVKDFIKPETFTAIESLKGREKDPVTWVALASLIANAIWGGRTVEKKIGKNNA